MLDDNIFFLSLQVLRGVKYDELPEETRISFQHQFEALVCLDYIIRNTDRGMDNWLIQYVLSALWTHVLLRHRGGVRKPQGLRRALLARRVFRSDIGHIAEGGHLNFRRYTDPGDGGAPTMKVAAIDNGLAFPWKHPDDWRA